MVQAHLPIPGIVALTIDYVWDSQTRDDLKEAHRAEFWEACDEHTTRANVDYSLRLACLGGNEGIIRMVIARGATNLDECLTPAVINGRETAVRVLLDINPAKAGAVLSDAARYGHLSTVQHVLQTRAYQAIHWNSAFMRACIGGREDICRALLAVSTPSEHTWGSLPSLVARRGRDNILRMFVEHGMNAHVSREEWMGAMHGADSMRHSSTVELIAYIIEKHYPQAPP
jgi:hypothetical protein